MLYLHEALFKGERGPQAGASYSGKYLHRVQVGVGADNSPKYRYFRTADEWQAYLATKEDGGKETPSKLKEKLEQEQKDSRKKAKPKNLLKSLFISIGDK